MRKFLIATGVVLTLCAGTTAQQPGPFEVDQLSESFLQTVTPQTANANSYAAGGVLGRRSNGGALGIDSLANWSSYFYDPGLDPSGFPQFTWPYTMVGRSPFNSRDEGDEERRGDHERREDHERWYETTWIPAPIIPVTLDLRDANGIPRFIMGHPLVSTATQFVDPVLKSPVFSNSDYTSSFMPTQFTDAVQRAEFFHVADEDWHTILRRRVAPAQTMILRQSADPVNHPTYRFSLNPDGSCCRFVLIDAKAFEQALFPPTPTDTTTVMGAAENAHRIMTRDLSTFLFNNAYLFLNGNPMNCCILGFHTYDAEPGSAANGWREKRYVMNYSSWVSPGLFRTSFTDVTALSHEVAEIFNDPFVNNVTPWWLAPNGNCQDNLETGDVIEGLPNATFPITLDGFTYHPQNEALLQWFASVTPSSAISHAYSYPDANVLTTANISQNRRCMPPIH